MNEELFHQWHSGDATEPTLVLLHGMGSTGSVWDPFLDVTDWPGPVLVVDLRGHGASPWSDHYSFGALAADVAQLMPPDADVVVFGHSMGGVVALTLASGLFRVSARAVMTCGIKPHWSEEELAGALAVASKGPRRFDDEDDARTWALRLGGLAELADSGTVDGRSMSGRGIRQSGGSWIAGHDPRSLAIGVPPMRALHQALVHRPEGPVPVLHTAGELDHMTGIQYLDSYGVPVHAFVGAGHNAIAEVPVEVRDRFLDFVVPML